MSKSLKIIIPVILVIIVGGTVAGYFYWQNINPVQVEEPLPQQQVNSDNKQVQEVVINEKNTEEVKEIDKTIDSDNDGLTDYEEINTYRTESTNPDTDGDGYYDGTEVTNGYNPLGEGLIENLILVKQPKEVPFGWKEYISALANISFILPENSFMETVDNPISDKAFKKVEYYMGIIDESEGAGLYEIQIQSLKEDYDFSSEEFSLKSVLDNMVNSLSKKMQQTDVNYGGDEIKLESSNAVIYEKYDALDFLIKKQYMGVTTYDKGRMMWIDNNLIVLIFEYDSRRLPISENIYNNFVNSVKKL